jgi:hypothetical protein
MASRAKEIKLFIKECLVKNTTIFGLDLSNAVFQEEIVDVFDSLIEEDRQTEKLITYSLLGGTH